MQQQLSIPELKVREQAEEYLRIEENTEFLTYLLRYRTSKRRVYLRPEMQGDLRSIASLIVQLSYLLFTCCVKQVNILVSKHFLLMNPSRKENTPEICCEYIMEKNFIELKEEEKKIIETNFQLYEFSSMQPSSYGKYVLYYMDLLLKMARSQFDKLKLPGDKLLARQLVNLQGIKNFLLPRIQTIEHPRMVILSFEESEVFREYSILVKVMNNSIFSTIKNCKTKNVFAEICMLEEKLAKSKERGRNQAQNSKEMEETIEELLRFLIKLEVIKVEQSISNSEKMEPGGQPKKTPAMATMPGKMQQKQPEYKEVINKQFNPNTKQYLLGEIEQTSIQERLYKCRINVLEKPWRQFTEQLYERLKFEALNNYNQNDMEEEAKSKEEKPGESLIKNEFIIEFVGAKGLLIVKYITPIELNIENTDLVMFQCNNIAYHWSNVNMELVEKSPNKLIKKKERYLSLKTITHLNISDRPLFKLLLMLDLVMLCAKIAEPELKRAMIRAEDYYRIEQISLKVNHMINLFIRKIERYYKIISDSETSKLS